MVSARDFVSIFIEIYYLMWQELFDKLISGDTKSLARAISLVENETEGYDDFMQNLPLNKKNKIIGITGPPGAGKSTLTDALISSLIEQNKKVAVLCVDPSSPFNLGALLGDRIRMSEWYNNPYVYIRSLASRGAMGGMHPMIIEIADLIKAANYDYTIIETVGVGQSEIEIAGLADATVVVLVPESGDEIQTMKAGLMEIADVFVINKSDRPNASTFVENLKNMMAHSSKFSNHTIPIVKTIALQKDGIKELKEKIIVHLESNHHSKKSWLLAEKAYQLIVKKRMQTIDKSSLKEAIESLGSSFNMYQFIKNY